MVTFLERPATHLCLNQSKRETPGRAEIKVRGKVVERKAERREASEMIAPLMLVRMSMLK